MTGQAAQNDSDISDDGDAEQCASFFLSDNPSALRKRVIELTTLMVVGGGLIVAGCWIWNASPSFLTPYTFGDRNVDLLSTSDLRRSLWGDAAVIIGYAIFLGVPAKIFICLAFSNFGRRLGHLFLNVLVVAVVADVLEDISLALWPGAEPVALVTATAAFATIKWVCLSAAAFAVPCALAAIVRWHLAARRARRCQSAGKDWWNRVIQSTPALASPAGGDDETSDWAANYAVPPSERAGEHGDKTAICLSGGGVRSACVAMGATQVFAKTHYEPELLDPGLSSGPIGDCRRSTLLDSVDYIISVSGGGYTAGARIMAVQPKGGMREASDVPSRVLPSGRWPLSTIARRIRDLVKSQPEPNYDPLPDQVDISQRFESGSVEFAHVRAHSSYIAESPGDLVRALAAVLKNLVAALVSIFCWAIVGGLVAGALLSALPLSAFVPLAVNHAAREQIDRLPSTYAAGLYAHSAAAWTAIGLFATLGVLLTAAAVLVEENHADGPGERLRVGFTLMARSSAGLALLIFVVTVGIPCLMRIVSYTGDRYAHQTLAALGGVVGLQYFVTLATILWRRRSAVPLSAVRDQSMWKKLPQGVLQQLLVLASIAAIAIMWIAALGSVASGAFNYLTYLMYLNPNSSATISTMLQRPSLAFTMALLGASLLVGIILISDVTSLSLHPFYRRRLARTFAVRRRSIAGQPPVAQPYPQNEATWLHAYGNDDDGPQFVFAAAAASSGEDKAAPGLDAHSFVLSADYIGGPRFGYLKTKELWDASTPRIRRDLTVQAAVAISGAAFASSMGRQNKGFQTLLAASGARLGTWLPNPHYVATLKENPAASTIRALPKVRGASYFYRELFSIHRRDAQLLQVTDGGHYENLGLVEALRRRCKVIYCIDGGGDPGTYLTGLADAMRLAKFELGVEITLQQSGRFAANDLSPGSGRQYPPGHAYAHLNERLTKGAVVRGTIQYPNAAGLGDDDDSRGVLIFAKAVLWEGCPDWLMTYAGGSDIFPHDSTADQWFNEGQFAAYTALGESIGREAIRAKNMSLQRFSEST